MKAVHSQGNLCVGNYDPKSLHDIFVIQHIRSRIFKNKYIKHNKYKTTMIGYNKYLEAQKHKTVYFIFSFEDGDYYYKYNKDDKFEIAIGGRCDRNKAEYKDYVYIPITKLIKI